MGARTYQELEAWLLADDLRRAVIAFLDRSPVNNDFRFCNNLRDAAGSACRNIAEGFARRRPRQFAPFMVIALGSLAEVSDQLLQARHRGLLSAREHEAFTRLINRARDTSEGLLRYLRRAADEDNRPGEPRPPKRQAIAPNDKRSSERRAKPRTAGEAPNDER